MRTAYCLSAALILLGVAACDDDTVTPARGSLQVTVNGLPGAAAADVTVTGPASYSRDVTASTTLTDLAPGEYTIEAANVDFQDSRYTPAPDEQDVTVASGGAAATATVTYAVSTARLMVNVAGLPVGATASITVTGPQGYTNTLQGSAALNFLTPGAYTITAADVVHNNVTYRATPATQNLNLPASATQVAASIAYMAITGSLTVTVTGLPTGQNASIVVTGPNAYSSNVTATATLTGLAPGQYTVTAANIEHDGSRYAPSAATQQVTVVAGTTAATATVAYAVATARLALTINGVPAGQNAAVTVTGPGGFNMSVTGSTTLNLLAPGTYTIAAANITHGGFTYTPNPASQNVNLAASATPTAATVTYTAPTVGNLTVTINGLPGGVNGAVTVTGPGGYSQTLTSTQTLGSLAPGSYTIAASSVASSLTSHNPAPASQNATVTGGSTASATVTYTSVPLSLGVQQILSGLSQPVYLTSPPGDSRLFIVEQDGRIRIYKNGALLTTPFLDVASLITFGGEQGLLSMAFDPSFASNGRFYIYYTTTSGDIAVDRYTAGVGSDVANAGSRTSVITIPHPTYGNHNGGLVMFGPDRMMYLATGDGGSGGDPDNNGQNINSLLGKMLRIDVSTLPYTSPPNNPYYGPTTGRDEIWAIGLRNPWRYAFDGNQLYIADVGQDFYEEVNSVSASTAGINYGWRIMEGDHCYNPSSGCNAIGLTRPVLEYSHANGNCSVTGGFVYRGSAIPELTGHYLFADYCVGVLRSFRLSGTTATEQRTWSVDLAQVTSFGQDAAGELYMLTALGGVYRIVKQ